MFIKINENKQVIAVTTGIIQDPVASGMIEVDKQDFDVLGLYYDENNQTFSEDDFGLDLVATDDQIIEAIGDGILDGSVI